MSYYSIIIFLLLIYMSVWFVFSLTKKRNDLADIAWGLGFVLVAWASLLFAGIISQRSILASLLVTFWGLRLSWHIFQRNKEKSEDYRYLAFRKRWDKLFYLRSYFQIYLLQGVFLFVISFPVLVINKILGPPLGVIDFIGFTLWLVGFSIEAVSDAQLTSFKKNPFNKNKIMQSGLWKYSRHPNYFGEVALWWGIWIISLSVVNGFFTIISPLTITILILKVTGVPMLEKRMSKNPDFIDYKKRTSVLIPLPPKKNIT